MGLGHSPFNWNFLQKQSKNKDENDTLVSSLQLTPSPSIHADQTLKIVEL